MSESTALTLHRGGQSAAAYCPEFSAQQIKTLKATIAKGCSDAELALFVEVCRAKGLDPFSRQIYAIKRNTQDGPVMTIQTGIDGFRSLADRPNPYTKEIEYEGQDPPVWCGPDGQWLDVWLPREPPLACRVTVYRKGKRPTVATGRYSDFQQPKNPLWQKMAPHMLAKAVESLALRQAFPQAMSGLHSNHEMAQAETGLSDPSMGGGEAVEEGEWTIAPAPSPELAKARADLVAVFSSEENCRNWLRKAANLELEDTTITDCVEAAKRANAAKAARAKQAPSPAPLGDAPKSAEPPKPVDLNKLKTRVVLRSAELFGDDDRGKDLFYRWADRAELLAVDEAKQRPSIAASSADQLQECIDALGRLTDEQVADFAQEVQAEQEAADAAFGDLTAAQRQLRADLPEKEVWD